MNALALAPIGHNNPPEPTPFELSKKEISDLCEEAKNWLDGGPIQSQPVADQIGRLMGMLRDAAKLADARRIEENKPFDEGKAAVQAKYGDLIADTKTQKGSATRAIEACKKVLQPWLDQVEKEKREAAEKAQREADEKARAAQEAVRAAQGQDFATKEDAEALLRDARKAEAAATKASRDKAHVAGTGRSIGLRTEEVFTVTDAVAAVRDIGATEGIKAALITAAKQYRSEWGHLPAGVTSTNERRL